MKHKRLVAIVALAGVLGLGLAEPRPAHASTTTNVTIGVMGFAAYLAIVFVATKLVFKYDNSTVSTIEDPLITYEQRDGRVQPLQKCRQQGGNVTLACW